MRVQPGQTQRWGGSRGRGPIEGLRPPQLALPLLPAQATPCALAILRDRNCCSEGQEKVVRKRYTERHRSKGRESRVLVHLGLPHPTPTLYLSRHSLHSRAACWLQAARGENTQSSPELSRCSCHVCHMSSLLPIPSHRSQETKAKHHVDREYQSSLAPFTEPQELTLSLLPSPFLPPLSSSRALLG